MAKKDNDDFFDNVPLPEDGKKVVGDVDGYWDHDRSAIRFKPMSVKMFDGEIQKDRASILILGITTAPTLLYTTLDEKDDEGKKIREYKKHEAGTPVGVWYKPGMRGIVKRCGVDCYLKKSGEKNTGKPSPMTTFDLIAAGETSMIPVVEDFRDKSRDFNTPFDPKGVKKTREPGDDEDEDPGF